MYNEGTPDFVMDQGMYYPTATNYGYYCTGFESPAEWEDHNRFFGVDGHELQYSGVQTEGLPYVYYTPNYEYEQSSYNPYNTYVPGAMVGVDGPYMGAQQYYPFSPYQEPLSSSGYVPVIVQPDFTSNTSVEPLMDTRVSFSHKTDGKSLKHGFASTSAILPSNPPKPAPGQSKLSNRVSESSRANIGSSKHSITQGHVSSRSFSTPTSTRALQGGGASGSSQRVDNRNVLSQPKQLNIPIPISDVYADFGSRRVDRNQSKNLAGRTQNVVNGSIDSLGEQNCGPRKNNVKSQLAVKAYTTKLGNSSAQGDIIIHTNQYNKVDFPVDYVNAKFFVIKSYSEDDVHKSIKYNVWSSTPHGNRKLQSAYEDSLKVSPEKPRSPPIFLFFSVNASGQFCGVAEMIGPVDFHDDMDFWQQDKWSGSFPVKWHIIKDVPNTSFRHIILENNENKPVTNSRDTQEIMYKKGLEMLKIYKNYPLNTSLLDDFMYYENRQKIMQQEKARHSFKSFDPPVPLPAIGPTHNVGGLVGQPSAEVGKHMEQKGTNSMKYVNKYSIKSEMSDKTKAERGTDITSTLKIGLLDINPRQEESTSSQNAAAPVPILETAEVLTVGSLPVKVNGFVESSKSLTVGSIPLDPRALQFGKDSTSI